MNTVKHQCVGAIILARLDSERLPGKGLMEINGKPILDYVLERIRMVEGIDLIILATSDRPIDNPLEFYASKRGIGIFRGAISDVAGRVLKAADSFGLDAIVRINGDSPLIDYETLTRGLTFFRQGSFDMVTNVLKRTFPVGMSVEIISRSAFSRGYEKMTDPDHFEHVTKYFYENVNAFEIKNIESGKESLSEIHLAVDTEKDLMFFKWLAGKMDGKHLDFKMDEIVRLYNVYMNSPKSDQA